MKYTVLVTLLSTVSAVSAIEIGKKSSESSESSIDGKDFQLKRVFGLNHTPFKKAIGGTKCTEVETQQNFDLQSYTSSAWYPQMQSVTGYQPIEDNYCTKAEYTLTSETEANVHNYANTNGVNENPKTADLCAKVVDPADPSKLSVGPCFLSDKFWGPYWIVSYNETRGYAVISGGQPFLPSDDEEEKEAGLCTTLQKTMNYSGLWIFTRQQQRDQALIDEILEEVKAKGFATSILNDVVQEGCTYEEDIELTKNKYGGDSKKFFNYGNN